MTHFTSGDWVATSDFGWDVNKPCAIYAGHTDRPNTPNVKKIASGIENPNDARLMAQSKKLYEAATLGLGALRALMQTFPTEPSFKQSFDYVNDALMSVDRDA